MVNWKQMMGTRGYEMYAENYEAALELIHSRPKMHKEGSLKRIKRAMAAFGHPELAHPVIHVAGTNGKGSVVNALRQICQAHGLTVGTFTSPFLMRFNERISVDDVPIPDDKLLALVNEVGPQVDTLDQAAPDSQLTEFEFITLLMFVYFSRQPLDVAIVEVGIGGLTDATNVVKPDVAVITTIGYDHMALLGDTLPEIAQHKAGIIKPHCPVVVGRVPAEAQAVIDAQAKAQASPMLRLGHEYTASTGQPLPEWAEQFNYQMSGYHFTALKIPMLGAYQVDNAAVAITAFIVFMTQKHLPLDPRALQQGLAHASWAGRLEKLNDAPLIVLDGAHNEPGIQALAQTLKTTFAQREIYVIFAALQDKATDKMLPLLAQVPNVHLVLTQFQGPRKTETATDLAQALTTDVPQYAVWQQALQAVLQAASAEDMIVLTGSLYFVSDVRQYFMADEATNQ